MADVFKIGGQPGKRLAAHYGKIRIGSGRWRRVKLYTDKSASRHRLIELQRMQDRRAAGLSSVEIDRLDQPLATIAGQYHAHLEAMKRDATHVRISRLMIAKLLDVTRWTHFRDINAAGIERVLQALAETPSYQNKYIDRAKAWVAWMLPEGWPNPLAKLRRVKERGGKQTRARRAATVDELRDLLTLADLPPGRRLAYALAAFNGLRRNEAARLTWGDLSLSSPIPFLRVRQKMGQTDAADAIPLHPYTLSLLRERTQGMPAARVLRGGVPDVQTMIGDLTRAGVAFTDDRGRRLDYHAMRHTFATMLDHSGASRATKKRLMRHSSSDVTDDYTHADMAEQAAAITRVRSPTLFNELHGLSGSKSG